MNITMLNLNSYSYANPYNTNANPYNGAATGIVAPNANSGSGFPTDSVTFSPGAFNNDAPWALTGTGMVAPSSGSGISSGAFNNDAPWMFATKDVCECNFGHNAAQEAFIVPVGDQDNPYQNFNATALPLETTNGQDPQQALLALLTQLGITPEMVAALREMGVDLLSLISEANGLESLSGIEAGQELILPTTHASNSGHAPTNFYGNGNTGTETPVASAAPAPAAAPAPTGSGNRPHTGDSHDHTGPGYSRPSTGSGNRPHTGDSHDHTSPARPRTGGGGGGGGRVLVR